MQPPQFPNKQTERLRNTRSVGVADLLDGKVDLSVVPFRYVTIYNQGLTTHQGTVLATVEWLEQFDWELVNVFHHDNVGFGALIRRRQPAAPIDRPAAPAERPQDVV